MTCWLCGLATIPTAPICKNGPCQICTAVTEVDEEINQAVANLKRLLSKRCDILSEHNRVHETLIRRLPVELKNRIFELLLPSRGEWGEIDRTKMRSFLATISVCREWRDVALSNPFLWSTMHIDLGKSNPSSRINDWILRSRTLPLTLHIQDFWRDNKGLEQSRKVLADAMSLCSNRLQSLSLNIPSQVLCGLQHNNFQYHRLTQLQITSRIDQPLSLLNPTASPEKIELDGVSFRSLHISWNRLISATVSCVNLEDVTQLFQHASQMTFCRISSLESGPGDVSMPPIIHHRLKTLELLSTDRVTAQNLLDSLTLPCLQEVEIFESILLTQLPALVHRSSCPLTKLGLYLDQVLSFDELQPLPGMTDLVVMYLDDDDEDDAGDAGDMMMRLLLGGYFPNLLHLTLRLQPFEVLWELASYPCC
jgi:hypothetical protein